MKYDFSNYKFRCSSLGYIMVDPKEKSNLVKYNEALKSITEKKAKLQTTNPSTKAYDNLYVQINNLQKKINVLEPIKDELNLSETCKTHLCDIYTSVVYNRREDIQSKYLEKGLTLEEDAITAYSLFTGEFHQKNKERRENEWIQGEMDFPDGTGDISIDTKVNWSIFQFNRVVAKPIKPLYHWQLDGYMWLWNNSKGKLVYTLLNTPEHLIVAEEKKLLYNWVGSEQDYIEACKELRRNHIYDDIPLEEKIRIFDVKRSDERIERIKKRVEECRIFLNNFGKTVVEEIEEDEDDMAA